MDPRSLPAQEGQPSLLMASCLGRGQAPCKHLALRQGVCLVMRQGVGQLTVEGSLDFTALPLMTTTASIVHDRKEKAFRKKGKDL